MLTVGLIGHQASGKSTLAHILTLMGVGCVEPDEVVQALYTDNKAYRDTLHQSLGEAYQCSDGSIHTKKIRDTVHHDFDQMKSVGRSVFPWVREALLEAVKQQEKRGVAYCLVPISFFSTTNGVFMDLFDKTILIDVQDAVLVERLVQRDRIAEADVWEGLKRGKSLYARFNRQSDCTIDNSAGPEQLYEQAARVMDCLRAWSTCSQ